MPNSDVLRLRAEGFLSEGRTHFFSDPPDYAAAARSFQKATELASDWGEPFHALGGALRQQGKLEEACEAERLAISLLPSDPRPLIALGWSLRLGGRYAEAVKFLEEGLSLKPHYGEADARIMLAETYECLGEIDKAVTIWEHVISMDSMYPSYERPMIEARKKLKDHGLTQPSEHS